MVCYKKMNGRTKYSTLLCSGLACAAAFPTSVQSQSVDFEKCNLAKCYFGTKYELVRDLADNFYDDIPFPDNICSQTITALVLSAALPSSCGSAYSNMRVELQNLCGVDVKAQTASCGSTPDDVTGYLILYVILYGFLIFFNYTTNHKSDP